MAEQLPADSLAQVIRSVVAGGGISGEELAASIGVHRAWLRKVMTGEIVELPLLAVAGICRRLRTMAEDIWEPGLAARVFRDFPSGAFEPDDEG